MNMILTIVLARDYVCMHLLSIHGCVARTSIHARFNRLPHDAMPLHLKLFRSTMCALRNVHATVDH